MFGNFRKEHCINTKIIEYEKVCHGQPLYIWISEPGQPFRSQFVLYRTDIGLIKQTINRTSRCNKVDVVRLYASFMLNLLLLKGQRRVLSKLNWYNYNDRWRKGIFILFLIKLHFLLKAIQNRKEFQLK